MSKIENPFYIHNNDQFIDQDNTVCDFYKNTNKIIVIALQKTPTEEFKEIFNKIIDTNFLASIKDYLTICEVPKSIIRCVTHRIQLCEVYKEDLMQFNHSCIHLDDTEIVLPVFNVMMKDLINYFSHYDQVISLNDVLKTITLFDIFNYNLKNTLACDINLYNSINSMTCANYWIYDLNCKLNITKSFGTRRFKYSAKSKNRSIM